MPVNGLQPMTHMLKAGEDRISTSIVEMDIIDLRIIAVIELRKYTTGF